MPSKSLQCNSQSFFVLCEGESRVKERPGSSQQDKLADALWTWCPLAPGLVKLNVILLPSQERKCTAVKPTYETHCHFFIAQEAEKRRPGDGVGKRWKGGGSEDGGDSSCPQPTAGFRLHSRQQSSFY